MIQVVLIRSHWSLDQRCLGWGHNLRKAAKPCAMWRHAQGRWANSLHFLTLLPMPPNASPRLSMGHFGTVWATCMISKCCHHKKGWPQPFNPRWKWWLSQHLPSFWLNLFGKLEIQPNHQFYFGLVGWRLPCYSGWIWGIVQVAQIKTQ